MLNEPRQRVTTYPGTVLWNIQRRLHHLQNISFDKKMTNSATFVRLDEVKCICSWPSWKMAAILDFRLINLTEWI